MLVLDVDMHEPVIVNDRPSFLGLIYIYFGNFFYFYFYLRFTPFDEGTSFLLRFMSKSYDRWQTGFYFPSRPGTETAYVGFVSGPTGRASQAHHVIFPKNGSSSSRAHIPDQNTSY